MGYVYNLLLQVDQLTILAHTSALLLVNIRGKILSEKDPAKQSHLRRTIGTSPDYYLTSMAAVTEDGKLAHADFSGSKVGGVAFGAANVIVVAGSNKIIKNEAEAHRRTHEFAYEGESARTRDVFKLPGSSVNHYEVIHKVQQFTPGRIQVILVEEALGF